MSAPTQIRVELVETFGEHATLHSILAADSAAAAVMSAAWLALGSSLAGRTEVVLRVVTHPPAVTT